MINDNYNIQDLFTRRPISVIQGIYSFIECRGDQPVIDNAITRKVNSFYEQSPFPNYEEYDDLSSFQEKASSGIYAKMLDEQIPFGVKIVDCGCGTAQLSAYLAHGGRKVIGSDLCLNSLKIANDFKLRNNINNLELVHADIFDLPFEDGSFDFVISKGVLHSTYDCKKAFQRIARLVRPGGFIIVGLYNKYARIPSWFRKRLYKIFPNSIYKSDYVLKALTEGETKKRSWILDQYDNPHEKWYSVDTVLKWFDENGIVYVNSIPKINFSETISERERLFQKHNVGSGVEHRIMQLIWMFTIAREGGLFDLIGRKKGYVDK